MKKVYILTTRKDNVEWPEESVEIIGVYHSSSKARRKRDKMIAAEKASLKYLWDDISIKEYGVL